MHSNSRIMLSSLVAVIFTIALISNAPINGTAVEQANDPLQISNDEVKNSYLQYIKLVSQGQGQGASGPDCQPGLGQLESDDLLSDNALCNPGLENQQDKLTNEELDQDIINKLSDNVEDKAAALKDKLEKLRERMEKAISEEEEEGITLPDEVRKKIDADDLKAIQDHTSKEGEQCREGDVLAGASNAEDLKVLSECQDAVGDVMHTKKMDDGDYKFLLKLEDQYQFLVNDKNEEKTDGLLVVEIVPPDQDLQNIVLPESGDKVHVWGAWVTDEPKGWHEIHPTWQITKE